MNQNHTSPHRRKAPRQRPDAQMRPAPQTPPTGDTQTATQGTATAQPVTPSTPFTGFDGLKQHVPFYKERTLRELVKRKIIPAVRPPGTRKLAFHLPSVDLALLRFQRGGIEN